MPDSEFTSDPVESDTADRGWLTGDPIYNGAGKNISTLEVTGSITVRAGFRVRNPSSLGNDNLFSYSATGETEDENFLYTVEAQSEVVRFFAESGPGDNHEALWELPFLGLEAGRGYILSFVRTSAGEVAAYLNGYRLGEVRNTTDTDDGEGRVSDMTASGGSNSHLNFYESSDADPYFAQGVEVESDAEGERAICDQYGVDFTDAEKAQMMTSDSLVASLASETGSLVCLQPDGTKSSGLVDHNGTLSQSDWAISGSSKPYIGEVDWLLDSAHTNTGISSLLKEGDLVLRLKWRIDATIDYYIASFSGDGENLATNYIYSIKVEGQTLKYFTEKGAAGTNVQAKFGGSLSWEVGDIHAVSLLRSDNGDGTADVWMILDGDVLQVSSTDGVDNSTYTTIDKPEGDSGDIQQKLGVGELGEGSQSSRTVLFFQILDQATSVAREQQVHQQLVGS